VEFIRFVFSGFWHFLGALVLFGAVFDGIAKIIRAVRCASEQAKES
jgi:hypothetical protein